MNTKFQELVRGFYFRRIVSSILVATMIIMTLPSLTAGAVVLLVNEDDGRITNNADIDLTSFFYRTGAASQSNPTAYTYGYGYGYSDGTYAYGYGYGYGYSYFASSNNTTAWVDGDARVGFFLGTTDVVSNVMNLSVDGSGVATVPIAMTLGGSSVGVTGVSIILPAGLEIDGGPGYEGELTVTADEGSVSGMSDAVTVYFETGDYDLAFSDEVIVVVPNDAVSAANLLVQIASSSDPDTIYTVSDCSNLESNRYIGDDETVSDLIDSTNYNLTTIATPTRSHCYTLYDGNIYIATRHASDFSTGIDSGSASTVSGGSSGGSAAKKDTAVEEEALVSEISEFSDMEGIPTDDWRYLALAAVFESGLFKGSTNADGETVIDLEGGMNRAMAATVLARYLECDTATAPDEKPFPDVNVDEWYAPSIACLKDMGVVNGKVHVDPPIYDPGGAVTRGEYLKLFIEGYLVKHPTMETAWRLVIASVPTDFADLSEDDWFAGYFGVAYDYGLIKGYMEDGFRYAKGGNSIIRVEAMKIAGDFLGFDGEPDGI